MSVSVSSILDRLLQPLTYFALAAWITTWVGQVNALQRSIVVSDLVRSASTNGAKTVSVQTEWVT